jgi:hypothetical protein
VQGRERADQQFLDAAVVAGHLVPAGSMFGFLARHRAELFPDGDYADLFAPPGTGRPSVPATQMAAVLTLQVLHDYSDRETAEAVRCDLRWKVALGLAVDDGGFHPSTLTYWRNRIAASDRPHRVSDAVRAVVAQTGIVAGRRRAVDSTILADAVASQDTVTMLVSAIRRVRREVPGAAGVVAAACTGHDYSRPGRPSADWSDPQARQDLVSALVNDANAVVAAFEEARLDGPAAEAVALLALIAGQDVEPAEGSDGTDGRWRIARREGRRAFEDRVISAVDPEARHARKRVHDRTDGYRVHLAADPGTGIITGEKLTRAAGPGNSDPEAAAEFLAAEHAAGDQPGDANGQGPLTWYGDSAYGTGQLRDIISRAGDEAVIKPKTPRPAAAAGRFTTDDFTADHDAGTLTCPAGITRRIPPSRTVAFGTACRGCPLRPQCIAHPVNGRTVMVHPHDNLLRAARRDWAADPALRKDYRTHRPHVERVVAQVATHRGRRLKLRYRGTARNNAWLKRRTAAVNLRTLIRHGLSRSDGAWILAS